MLLWCALRTRASPSPDDALAALALWALGFTPRVTRLDEAVLMELRASCRLFGGEAALRARVEAEAATLDAAPVGWAPHALAALALARAGGGEAFSQPLAEALAPLPLHTLSAAAAAGALLARAGCRTLGDLQALPRGALGRRFGDALLHALDQAHGRRPEAHAWISVPERFEARFELPWRQEQAAGLLDGAQRLLLQLGGWLTARQAGVSAFTLRWAHDALRARDAGEGGALTVRTATPTRHTAHLARLLAEHLAHVTLAAPVGELWLRADEVQPLPTDSASLLPDEGAGGEPLPALLERLAARLGPERVRWPVLHEDHRPEAMTRWRDGPAPPPPARGSGPRPPGPQPAFLLERPLRLAVRQHRPLHHGELQLLLGPQRVEGGWWDREPPGALAEQPHGHVARDYWVAWSDHAGLLWIFQTRPRPGQAGAAGEGADTGPAWYLHGHFG